jgi:uncharacterized protein YggE
MDTLQKKVLGWVGVAVAVMLVGFLAVLTSQISNTATTTNTVTFSGEGKVLAKPDIAITSFSIVTEAKTSKAAQDDNSVKSKAVTDALAGLGIADKDIQTSGYNIYPQYDYTLNKSVLKGYQVNQTITVKVRDLTKTDDVLAAVVAAGANQVNSFQYTIENPEQLQEQARQQAITDAKQRASVLEDQLGIRLGRIVNFSEDNNGYAPRPMMMDSAKAVGMGGGAITPVLPTGENEITVDVSITYQIK